MYMYLQKQTQKYFEKIECRAYIHSVVEHEGSVVYEITKLRSYRYFKVPTGHISHCC